VETPRRVNVDVGRESASVETPRETHFLLAVQHGNHVLVVEGHGCNSNAWQHGCVFSFRRLGVRMVYRHQAGLLDAKQPLMLCRTLQY